MRPVLFLPACAFLGVAHLVPAPPREDSGRELVWHAPVVDAAVLGQRATGADLTWLRTLQLIGSERYAAAGYPTLARWVGVINELDPQFAAPYTLAGILLSTSPTHAPDAERLLARAEANFPDDWRLPMMRGFVAYFGLRDIEAAAAHYRRAARFPDAPAYLGSFAERLARDGASCRALRQRLGEASRGGSAAERQWIAKGARDILVACGRRMIEQAEAARALEKGPTKEVAVLLSEGWLSELPPTPPGECWTIDDQRHAVLGKCP